MRHHFQRWLAVTASVLAAASSQADFHSQRTALRMGTTAAIPLQSPTMLKVAPDGIIEILEQPSVSTNQPTAFARVRALREGNATLRDEAGNTLEVQVVAGPSQMDELRRPRIFAPAQGAWVWGSFSVGVELIADDVPLPDILNGLRLLLPDGTELEPTGHSTEETGPQYLIRFEVDAGLFDEDRVDLTAVLSLPSGKRTSEPVTVHAHQPDDSALLAGECEAFIDGARPNRYKDKIPKVSSAPSASGGQYIANYSAGAPWVLPVTAVTNEYYQLMLQTRGDLGANTYPTIGIYRDEERTPVTSGRIADHNWHRIPIGQPFALEAGEHLLTVYFENDFHVRGRADRNLYLDRFELVRLPAEAGALVDVEPPLLYPTQTIRDPLTTGMVTLTAHCRWNDPEHTPPPAITLVVNGEPVRTEYTHDARFQLYPDRLKEGANEFWFATTDAAGRSVTTPPQPLVRTLATTAAGPLSEHHRYNALDPAWGDSLAGNVSEESRKKKSQLAVLFSNHSAHLQLPTELEGSYKVRVVGYGNLFEGPPVLEATLHQNKETIAVGSVELPKKEATTSVGQVELTAGAKTLEVAFVNDHYVEDKGDRNACLRAVILERAPAGKDEKPPTVRLLYPAPGATVAGADVVVAEVADNRRLNWADLVIDDKPVHTELAPRDGLGKIVLPLLTRALAPGPHTLQIKARDNEDNYTLSDPIPFTIAEPGSAPAGPYARAVHLLNRFGCGPEPSVLADVLILGEKKWLQRELGLPLASDAAALYDATQRFRQVEKGYNVPRRAAHQLLVSGNPVQARFNLWVQNHFSTELRKTGGLPKWDEHMAFTELGVAPFRELLLASATSPAMLIYLDQNRSFGGQINENYAREIMELHTLGVDGGYNQQDVTELARLLTGWTAVEESDAEGMDKRYARTYRFAPNLCDREEKVVLGAIYPSCAARDRFAQILRSLDILAAHPSTARFIAGKLAEHYIAVPAPEGVVNDLANVFHQTGGDLREMLLAVADHPAFWAAATEPRFTTPFDYGLRMERMMYQPSAGALAEFLRQSGTPLFDRVTPDGYPEEAEAYASTASLLERWKYAAKSSSRTKALLPWSLQKRPKEKIDTWEQRVTDFLALRLTGHLLGPESNQAVTTMLRESREEQKDPARDAAALVCQLPEANLK